MKLIVNLMFYQLDSQNNTKPKTKLLTFYEQQSYFSKIVSKIEAKITISFLWKIPKITIIFWGLVSIYLVPVYPTNRKFGVE